MKFVGTEQVQLGQTGWLLGSLPNLLSGSLEVGIYICPKCKKIEFFSTSEDPIASEADDALPQVVCPSCGKSHDFDYTKCPFCKHSY